jgi:hypothetical protein
MNSLLMNDSVSRPLGSNPEPTTRGTPSKPTGLQVSQERMHRRRPRAAVANDHVAQPVHRGWMKSARDAQDFIWLRHAHSAANSVPR